MNTLIVVVLTINCLILSIIAAGVSFMVYDTVLENRENKKRKERENSGHSYDEDCYCDMCNPEYDEDDGKGCFVEVPQKKINIKNVFQMTNGGGYLHAPN